MDSGMTRASAVPARGSASLPPSERATPNPPVPFGERCGSVGNLRACDFGEKIRQLELIGTRLRGEVDGILQEAQKHSNPHPRTVRSPMETEKSFEAGDQHTFRDLADISHEQHAIEEMKSQLDHLQHKLREPALRVPTLPSMPLAAAFRSTRPRADFSLPDAVLERELREARERSAWLENQLTELHHQLAGQAEAHRSGSEELKARLYELQQEHQQTLRLREDEQRQQQELVTKLRESLNQLQDANREQEHTLLETNSKLDMAQQNHYVLESTLAQIRSLLNGVEQRRQRPFFDSDPVPKQSISLLAHTLERYIQECECEIDRRSEKAHHLERTLEDNRRMFQQENEDLERQWRERLHSLQMESEAKVSELRSAEASSQRRADDLTRQVEGLREAREEVSRRAESAAREAESRLARVRHEAEGARAGWQEKRAALESALDAAQRETAAARSEREQHAARTTEAEGKLQDLRSQVSEIQTQLHDQERLRREERERSAQLEGTLGDLQAELEAKRAALVHVERAMETLREETSLEITRVRAEGKLQGEAQVRSLSERLSKAGIEQEALNSELRALQEELAVNKRALEEATAGQSMLRIQMEGTQEEKTHLQGIIGNRTAEIERLTAERDYYFKCLDEKTEEVSLLKAEKQRLIVQLEDKMADLAVLNKDRYGSHNLDMNALVSKLGEKDRLLDELHSAREQLLRRLKAKEKAQKEVELERERLREEIASARDECEAVLRERKQLFEELRESRREAMALASELEAARFSGSDREVQLQQSVQELTGRLRAVENDMRSVKPKASPGEKKAVRVGNRVMRESPANTGAKAQLDSVKSRLRELEGRAVAVETERKRLKAENDRLCRLMQRITAQNEKLSSELEFYVSKAQNLRGQLADSEAMRDRLAGECEEARQQMDTLEAAAAKSKSQARSLTERLEALRKASASVVAKASQSEGQEMRSMLADVRAILSSYARPHCGDLPGDRASPVGTLLLDGELRNGRKSP